MTHYNSFFERMDHEAALERQAKRVREANSEYLSKHPSVKVIATPDKANEKRYIQCPFCGRIIEFTLADEDYHNKIIYDSDNNRINIDYWTITCTNCNEEHQNTEYDIITRTDSALSCSNAYIPYDELMRRFNNR